MNSGRNEDFNAHKRKEDHPCVAVAINRKVIRVAGASSGMGKRCVIGTGLAGTVWSVSERRKERRKALSKR